MTVNTIVFKSAILMINLKTEKIFNVFTATSRGEYSARIDGTIKMAVIIKSRLFPKSQVDG